MKSILLTMQNILESRLGHDKEMKIRNRHAVMPVRSFTGFHEIHKEH